MMEDTRVLKQNTILPAREVKLDAKKTTLQSVNDTENKPPTSVTSNVEGSSTAAQKPK